MAFFTTYKKKSNKKQFIQFALLTGILINVPLFIVGYDNKGTTGTEPFLIKIGPWIGVIDGFFGSEINSLKKKTYIGIIRWTYKVQIHKQASMTDWLWII